MDDRRSGWWQALTGVIDQSRTATGDDLAQLLSEAAPDGSV